MNRREFLKNALGAVTVVAPAALVVTPPVRRIWQVGAQLERPSVPEHPKPLEPGHYKAVLVPPGRDPHLAAAALDLGIPYSEAIRLKDTPKVRAARRLWKEYRFGEIYGASIMTALRKVEEHGVTVDHVYLNRLREKLREGYKTLG